MQSVSHSQQPQLLNFRELCLYLRGKENTAGTVKEIIKFPGFPSPLKIKKTYYYSLKSVDNFLDNMPQIIEAMDKGIDIIGDKKLIERFLIN